MRQNVLAFIVLGLAAPSGCASGEPSVSVLLTDAPGDVSAAVVTIDRIYLQGDGADDSGRVVLRDQPFTTDLLSLSNDVAVLVDDEPVPAGTYGQLRFVIDGAYIDVEGDGIYATPGYAEVPPGAVAGELRTPSWDTSGFKVVLPAGELDLESDQRILVVDFDVADSFGQATGSHDWVMRPTLRAQDLAVTGSVTVVIDVGDADPAVMTGLRAELVAADGSSQGTAALTDADGDGRYQASFLYLDPERGPFSIARLYTEAHELVTTPALPIRVDLESGQDATVELDLEGVIVR